MLCAWTFLILYFGRHTLDPRSNLVARSKLLIVWFVNYCICDYDRLSMEESRLMWISPAKFVTPSSSFKAFMIFSMSSPFELAMPTGLPWPLIDNLDCYCTLLIKLCTSLIGVNLSGLPLVRMDESTADLFKFLIFLLPGVSCTFWAFFIDW